MGKYAPLNLTPEEIIAFTPQWEGERFADGRPKVATDIVERMKNVTITQAWGFLNGRGYLYQHEGNWQSTQPGKVMTGRAVTVMYMPRREDLREVIYGKAKEAGCIGDQVSWPIDTLVQGDVYVADIFGKIKDGAAIGDNLATSILAKSGNGVVHDGSVRDSEGIEELADFVGYCRGYDPAVATRTVQLMGINTPVRIGSVTVVPGDVVLARDLQVVFIPAHLAEELVVSAELISLRDIFGKMCLREGRYTPGEIDRKWEAHIEAAFVEWLQENRDDLPAPASTIDGYLQQRASE